MVSKWEFQIFRLIYFMGLENGTISLIYIRQIRALQTHFRSIRVTNANEWAVVVFETRLQHPESSAFSLDCAKRDPVKT